MNINYKDDENQIIYHTDDDENNKENIWDNEIILLDDNWFIVEYHEKFAEQTKLDIPCINPLNIETEIEDNLSHTILNRKTTVINIGRTTCITTFCYNIINAILKGRKPNMNELIYEPVKNGVISGICGGSLQLTQTMLVRYGLIIQGSPILALNLLIFEFL